MTIKIITRAIIWVAFKMLLLTGWSSALAAETSPMLTDPAINEAYKNCELFVFANKNDGVLSSDAGHFYNLPENYWNQGIHDQCGVAFRSKTLMPRSSTDDHRDGEYVDVMIVRRRYLAASHFCEENSDYDECLERVVFRYYGFYEVGHGFWKRKVYNLGDVGGNLEKSMSETINGTIKNSDGITVINEWKRPYHAPDQTGSDLIVLNVIRRTPFGYIFSGGGYGIAIPVDETEESQIKATELINRIIDVVQSVRMKNGG